MTTATTMTTKAGRLHFPAIAPEAMGAILPIKQSSSTPAFQIHKTWVCSLIWKTQTCRNRRALPWRAWDWLACSQRGAAAGAKNRFRQNAGSSRKFAFQAKPRGVRSSFSGLLSA